MAQSSLGFALPEGILHPEDDLRLDIQGVVAGQHPPNRQGRHSLQGMEVGFRIGGGEPGGQGAFVDQVAGEQVARGFLPEAHMAGGVARGVENGNAPAPKV